MASGDPGARGTAVDTVTAEIIDGIKYGRYVPGQRLVEADLTSELGVSRGPLREAFGRLAAEGLLEIEPYRGALVRRLRREDIIEVFEVREALEGQAAALAAARIGLGENRAALDNALAQMRDQRARTDTVDYMDLNEQFHALIVDLSGNRTLTRLVGQLQVQVFRLFYRRLADAAARERSIDDHVDVAGAILAGDSVAAERAMRAHVRASVESALQVWPVPAQSS